MSKLTVRGFLWLAISCGACANSDPAPAGTSDPFVGKWSCSVQRSLTFTNPTNIPPDMSTEPTTMTITSANGKLNALNESDGGSNCTVAFTSSGTSATLVDGQMCTTSQGVVITYTSGTATVNGSTLTSTLAYDVAGTLTIGGMPRMVAGTGSSSSTCSRISPPPGQGGTTGGW